jgi:hypothetical protein
MSEPEAPGGDSGHVPAEVLDPVSRLSEIMFGLLMVMSFTGTFSVSNPGNMTIQELLKAGLGCNIAWGIADGFMYLIGTLCDRGHGQRLLMQLKKHPLGAPQAAELLAERLPFLVNKVLTVDEVTHLHKRLLEVKAPTGRLWPTLIELRGAVAVFCMVFISTLPVILPFMFMTNPVPALHLSHAIALVMMILIGQRLGHYAGARQPWLTGLAFALVGSVLVTVIIALGG